MSPPGRRCPKYYWGRGGGIFVRATVRSLTPVGDNKYLLVYTVSDDLPSEDDECYGATIAMKESEEGFRFWSVFSIEKLPERSFDMKSISNEYAQYLIGNANDGIFRIFAAGFSTADKITNVSGRGVGLDVVKTQIEKLNGSIVVTSEPGLSSKFSIRLPLTVAIIQGLLIRVGSEVYSIPIASVIESVRVHSNEINKIDNYEVLNIRNEVISVLRLSRLFGIKNVSDSEYSFIVIVGTQDKKVGVMVDALIGEEDVVIKPLRDQFTNSPGIAGASILGDGSVSLIIDVSQLLELGVKQEITARNGQNPITG